MQQWKYHAIKYTGSEIFYFEYQAGKQQYVPIYLDPTVDATLRDTLRRWIAHLGTEGLELMGILTTDDGGQELIFKQPA